jgi:uncharacterized protein (TIGR03382 family)
MFDKKWFAAGMLASVMVTNASADFIGDDYQALAFHEGVHLETNDDTALFGPDTIGQFFDLISYDVEVDTITLQSLVPEDIWRWEGGIGIELIDLNSSNGDIVGITILNATGDGWTLIEESDISFTATSIYFDLDAIAGTTATLDQSLVLQITTAPAPGVASLLAMCGLSAVRRRRR